MRNDLVKEPIEETWKRMSIDEKLEALLSLVLRNLHSLDLCIGYVQALAAERVAEEKRRALDTEFARLQAEKRAEEDERDTDPPTTDPESAA